MLLENKSHVREDEEEVATLGSALITPTKSEQGHNYNSTASAVRPQSKQEEDKLSGGSGQPKGFISQSEGGNYIEEQQQDEIWNRYRRSTEGSQNEENLTQKSRSSKGRNDIGNLNRVHSYQQSGVKSGVKNSFVQSVESLQQVKVLNNQVYEKQSSIRSSRDLHNSPKKNHLVEGSSQLDKES